MTEVIFSRRKSEKRENSKAALIFVSLFLCTSLSLAAERHSRQVQNVNNYYHTVTRSDHKRVIYLPVRPRNRSLQSVGTTAASTVFFVRTVQPKIIRKVLTEMNGVLVYKNESDRKEGRAGKRFNEKVKSQRRQINILSRRPLKQMQRTDRKTLSEKRRLKQLRPRIRVPRPHTALKLSERTHPRRKNVYKSRARIQVRSKTRVTIKRRKPVLHLRNFKTKRPNSVPIQTRLRPPKIFKSSHPANQTLRSQQRIFRKQKQTKKINLSTQTTNLLPINEKPTSFETSSDAATESNATTPSSPARSDEVTVSWRPRSFSTSFFNSSSGWWKGDNVCVEEKSGVFGRNKRILSRLPTRKLCSERRKKLICVETYNIGGQLPVSTTAYFCCPGFAVSTDRERCDESANYQEIENFQRDSSIVNRINFSYSPITREAPDGKVLTIFMPSDEVIEEAFLFDSGGAELIGTAAVQSFFENHLILNQKILSAQMRNNQVLMAFSGNPIRINFFPSATSDVMTANCRKVSLADEVSDNSIVHYIDGVLRRVKGNIYDYLLEHKTQFSSLIEALRASGVLRQLRSSTRSFTLFAPTNDAFDAAGLSSDSSDCLRAIVGNLLVRDVICSAAADGNNQTILTLQSDPVTLRRIGDVMYANEAIVTKRDVMTTNGVIHEIDRVLSSTAVNSMLEILSNQKQFSTMVNLFQIAGIKNALATGTNFTLIVPTNKAFKKTSRSELRRLTTYVEDLRSVLMFHLIPEKVKWKQLKTTQRLETLNPPNDIHVNYYAMKSVVRSRGRKRYVQKTATTVQCARILGQPRSLPCNGELYFVDKVLTPPTGSLLTSLIYSKNSNFSIFLKAIRRSGLEHLFEGSQTLTLFAPSNRIFARIPSHVTNRLLENRYLLIKLIKFHLIPGYHCAHELLQKPSRRRTLLRSTFTTCPKRGRVYLGRRKKRLRAKVIESNIEATNGVIHAIDNILLPRKFKVI